MTTFKEFAVKVKMRPDYGDMIQVRYVHPDGENYDTWVSGEEVLQRLASETAEERLRRISQLDWEAVKAAKERLPEEGKKKLGRKLVDRLADEVKGAVGGSVIGDSFADALRGRDSEEDPYEVEREKWRAYLKDDDFRAKVISLAWIQLEGSFPDDDDVIEASDDWI